MDEVTKELLLTRFRDYLDDIESQDDIDFDAGTEEKEAREGGDLYSLFVELAALRTEVKIESRHVKEALDQFRSVFEPLRSGHAALERDLERTRAAGRERERAITQPLLLEIIGIRDRLAAGLRLPPPASPPWYVRLFGFRPSDDGAPFREGLAMTLRRIDLGLRSRQVVVVPTVGRPFDPKLARAVATVSDPTLEDGVVVEEVLAGFLWEDDVLRLAEVVVNKLVADDMGEDS